MTTQHQLNSKIGIIVLIPVLWFFFAWFGYLPSGNFPHAMTSGWQAVFLSNNQTYFGKLEDYNHDYVKLTNVYYLRAGGNLQQGGEDDQKISLVKLGGEFHGPEDVMYIHKSEIMFWENLRDNARVVELIHSVH